MDDYRGAAPARTAEALLLRRYHHYHGAIYLIGYVIECWTKVYLDQNKIPYQRSGKDGGIPVSHNLAYLLGKAGLGPAIYSPLLENEFVTSAWGVDMRYRPDDFFGKEEKAKDLFAAARKMSRALKRKVI